MTSIHLLPPSLSAPPDYVSPYEAYEWRNACAILAVTQPEEWQDIIAVLSAFRLLKSAVKAKDGPKSLISTAVDRAFYARGWKEQSFDTAFVVDGAEIKSPTHKVDCFKNGVGLEVEWNNKDPFYDRDLNNFRLLFDLRVISVGVIITRSDALQGIFNSLGKGKSYGQSTTHMGKLLPKVEGGGAGGCPILVFGITPACYDVDC